ncbi:magnesium dechelatase SGRL, chloroplastic [Macadamia integrifolia]|uniref:magnesium dechelatase SGRL, chloroplastic n=1 Tax=Macadamia integrifolia TaxID=60698 RepID=UPI001C4E6297|nr:magnesium dechelatase SGRL, chloroplastic [Macadamia integrifolia]
MACHTATLSSSPRRNVFSLEKKPTSPQISSDKRPIPALISSLNRKATYNPLVFQAAKLLGPTARFQASKLKVVFMAEAIEKYTEIVPRTYILSHCDMTANLTLAISNSINLEQLKGWYNKDDVVAEWRKVKDELFLHIHCHVSGPNHLLDIAAEFRYHIFTKELPLVLKAMLHGDSILFKEHPELMETLVWVNFHSSSKKYNRRECWGPLKDAAERTQEHQLQRLLSSGQEVHHPSQEKLGSPKSILQALVLFLL